MRVLITGASGYVGRRLVDRARKRGHAVVAAVRDRRRFCEREGVAVVEFDLARPAAPDSALDGVDAVLHLGAMLGDDSLPSAAAEDLNVSGTRALLEAARRQRVRRFVFLSSQSAAADSPTRYGRSKWQIERLLSGPGECAARTGLVCGGPFRGLYGTLLHLARRTPLLPVVRADAPVYPLHVDDLCAALVALAESSEPPPPLVRIAPAASMPFGDCIRMLAESRLGARVRLLPIPGAWILTLSRLTERLPFLPTVSGERVRGLMALRPMDVDALPGPPGALPLRDVRKALEDEGRRRRLLAEGRALARYVLARQAPGGVARRYARAVIASAPPAEPLELSWWLRAFPPLLRLREPLGAGAGALGERLALATRVVEMTPAAAPIFHRYARRPLPLALLALGGLVIGEALLLPVRWLAGRRRDRRGGRR
jgi:NADH dehydrogenase